MILPVLKYVIFIDGGYQNEYLDSDRAIRMKKLYETNDNEVEVLPITHYQAYHNGEPIGNLVETIAEAQKLEFD